MVYVRGDDLSRPIESDKVRDSSRSTKSPFCRGGNALHVDSLDTPFIAQTCPRANCKRRRSPSWQLHKWEKTGEILPPQGVIGVAPPHSRCANRLPQHGGNFVIREPRAAG